MRTLSRRTLGIALAAMLLLVGCAPGVKKPADVVSAGGVPTLSSFHPHESGLEWRYLYEGDALDAQAVTHSVLGPMTDDGRILIVMRAYGRGYDHRYYRSFGPDGVFLHRESRPGVELRYDPPLQEFPSAIETNRGAQWSGTTRVSIRFDNGTTQHETLEYLYVIQENRRVTLPVGEIDVLVIDFQSKDASGARVIQQLWYAPYVGYLKLRDGAVLVASNASLRGNR
jgi:hypothetical protein